MSEPWSDLPPAPARRPDPLLISNYEAGSCGAWNTIRILSYSTLIGIGIGVLIWKIVK